MPAMKCPNPHCPFLFDSSQVPPGALIVCPQCTARFTLEQAAPPPPVAPSAPPINPEAPAVPAREEKQKAKRSDGIFGTIAMVGGLMLVFGVLAAAIVVAGWMKGELTSGEFRAGSEQVVEDLNFSYKNPGEGWSFDGKTKLAMGVNVLVLSRTDPTAWVALHANDYGKRSPLPFELREKMYQQLDQIFLEVPRNLEVQEATWAGHPASRIEFRATERGTDRACAGECFYMSYQGIGYWFYAWALEQDVASVLGEFDTMRNGFHTLKFREKWSSAVSNEVILRGKSSQYRLSCYERIWTRPEGMTPKDEDPNADLWMQGVLKGRGRGDFHPEADVLVLMLDQTGDPMTIADAYLRERFTRDEAAFGKSVIEVVNDPPDSESDPAIGPKKEGLPTVRWQVGNEDKNASRANAKFVTYAAMATEKQTIVAVAWCKWSERRIWENRLVQLVGSLRK